MMPGLPGPGRDPGPAGRTAGPGPFGGETRDHARRFTCATRPAKPAHEGARRCTPCRGSRALRNDVPVAQQMNGPVPASRDSIRLHWRMTTSSWANRVTASPLARVTRRAPLSRTAAISGARSTTCPSADLALIPPQPARRSLHRGGLPSGHGGRRSSRAPFKFGSLCIATTSSWFAQRAIYLFCALMSNFLALSTRIASIHHQFDSDTAHRPPGTPSSAVGDAQPHPPVGVSEHIRTPARARR